MPAGPAGPAPGAICGPLLGGWLLSRGIAYPWGFYVFAAVGAIGALAISAINVSPRPDEPMPVAEADADRIVPH